MSEASMHGKYRKNFTKNQVNGGNKFYVSSTRRFDTTPISCIGHDP
jgi:hypothetical protein